MTISAILPLRSLEDGKQRLGTLLTPAQRTALIKRLFQHAQQAIVGANVIDHLFVVSPDHPTLRWAATMGALPIHQPDHGLNAGLEYARTVVLAQAAPDALLVVLPDLPLVEAADVRGFVAQGGSDAVVLAADRHGLGTNALMLPAANGLPFCFGQASFAAHRGVARAAGLVAIHDPNPRLACDLDTVDDWHQFGAVGTPFAHIVANDQ